MKKRESPDTCSFKLSQTTVYYAVYSYRAESRMLLFYSLCLVKIVGDWRVGVEITGARSHPSPQGTPGERWRERETHSCGVLYTQARGPCRHISLFEGHPFSYDKTRWHVKVCPNRSAGPIWCSRGVNSSQETEKELYDDIILVLIIYFYSMSQVLCLWKGRQCK